MKLKKFIKRKPVVKRGKGLSRRKPATASKSLTKAIKKVMYRQAETKYSGVDETEYTMNTSNLNLFPSVNLSSWAGLEQGVGDGQRVGTKIDITKANLKFILRRNNTTSSRYPLVFHIWIGYLRQNRNDVPDPFFVNFYEDGTSTLPFNGTMLRTLRNVNKNLFTIHKHLEIKLGPSTSSTSSYNNNDFPIMVKRTISLKPLLGKLTYGDDASSANFNKDLWMWCGYTYLDDSIDNLAVSPSLLPVDLLYFVDVEYKDF